MTLKVIGTGFGRTGTDAMREALNLLGFGPCHHMFEVGADENQKQMWRAVAAGGKPNWPTLFSGFNSCVDWPSAYYWPELVNIYPDAKVILTWRSTESWWASYEKTILQTINKSTDPQSLGIALVANRVFDEKPGDREHVTATYEANVAAVKASISPERLLVYKIGDGWGPLCAHLDVPVPDIPFPQRNSTKEYVATGTGT